MVTSISHSPAETQAIGESWGRAASAGWLIGLSGGLGAGKTQIVKGIARGLGIRARVHSPTYTLLHCYEGGRLPLVHVDLYRLSSPSDVWSAGLEGYLLEPSGVTVVEWIERWLPPAAGGGAACGGASFVPAPFRRVEINLLDEQRRQILYEDIGA